MCVDDWKWTPQIGGGNESQPQTSHQPDTPQGLQYIMQKLSKRTYAKNAAADLTYQVKIDEENHRECIEDIRDGHVLQEAQGDLVGNDLGRVVI